MCGRSARPFDYGEGIFKTEHIILDMGDNVIEGEHGCWSDDTDWEDLFYNPQIPKTGKAPVKKCPICECVNPASARVCKGKIKDLNKPDELLVCAYEFPIKSAVEDTIPKEMMRITKEIDVKKNIEQFKDRTEYYSYFETIKQVAKFMRLEISENNIDDKTYNQILFLCTVKIKEWFKLKNKRINKAYEIDCKRRLDKELKELGFIINTDYIIMEETNADPLSIVITYKTLKEFISKANEALSEELRKGGKNEFENSQVDDGWIKAITSWGESRETLHEFEDKIKKVIGNEQTTKYFELKLLEAKKEQIDYLDNSQYYFTRTALECLAVYFHKNLPPIEVLNSYFGIDVTTSNFDSFQLSVKRLMTVKGILSDKNNKITDIINPTQITTEIVNSYSDSKSNNEKRSISELEDDMLKRLGEQFILEATVEEAKDILYLSKVSQKMGIEYDDYQNNYFSQ